MEVNYTDVDYANVNHRGRDKYEVYCDGEKVEMAQEASSSHGFVKFMIMNGAWHRYEYKYGNVQILRKKDTEPKVEIDFINETVIYDGKVLDIPIKAIQEHVYKI
jgi:hypothetical protein